MHTIDLQVKVDFQKKLKNKRHRSHQIVMHLRKILQIMISVILSTTILAHKSFQVFHNTKHSPLMEDGHLPKQTGAILQACGCT